MLLLSKSIEEIQSLVVFTDLSKKQQGLYVDDLGQGWWFFYISHSAKAKLDNEGLREVKEEVFTPCPSFLLKLIVENRVAQLTDPSLRKKIQK
ncbi:hypothetical protein [Shewanella phaeophyticola]|uniref:Uncharacterized protein n=1 Tax=Shewanella phaeophyticola TaxID=2978345 RepID=A0ABT2P5N8_9GAMM|nr:hypothetical protein [Shewanella sp. KJ10-1]MCT8986561.1 hypothetical protein [Shewanella sp. KJ10-1]